MTTVLDGSQPITTQTYKTMKAFPAPYILKHGKSFAFVVIRFGFSNATFSKLFLIKKER